LRRFRPTTRTVLRTTGVAALLVSVVYIGGTLDVGALTATAAAAWAAPGALAAIACAYALAFVVRAGVWMRVVPGLGFGHALAAIHVSLAGNHVLPFRLGEVLRVTSVVRRARVPLAEATASTVLLRGADVLAVAGIAAVLAPSFVSDLLGPAGIGVVLAAVAGWAAGVIWLRRLASRRRLALRLPVVVVVAGAAAAWLLESAVLWQAAQFAGIELDVGDAILVTSVTIAAQTLAVAPSGIGTYEAAATAALVAFGAEPGAALAAAVAAHAFKTAYSLGGGAIAAFVPSPGLFGRMRLPRRRLEVSPRPAHDGPIVLFLPAHDEEASVARVVRRVPARVLDRDVRCVVVDDGSTDSTASVARLAGAEVLGHGANRGLGAAVRTGLGAAVEQGAAAVAFCDADGEYAPEELERLVAPILAGDADYVVGSRFAGGDRHMRPHRLLGNKVLTRLLAFAARTPISDGQSGYRAFSRAAAADAEIVHDFNYAQVVTLDLLAKGYRYAEVPISYAFRTEGTSFVRLGTYLRRVVPAVHRELNAENA
jgi:uncharacterized membrane protein YbhN (UPF0104 family)